MYLMYVDESGDVGLNGSPTRYFVLTPDGHPKLLHLWPVKLLQAGRVDYADSGAMDSRAAASLSL